MLEGKSFKDVHGKQVVAEVETKFHLKDKRSNKIILRTIRHNKCDGEAVEGICKVCKMYKVDVRNKPLKLPSATMSTNPVGSSHTHHDQMTKK